MIPVVQKAEPSTFNNRVRQPGQSFLASCSSPTHKDWSKHSYWQRIKDDLYSSYGGICAYTGEWFPRTSVASSVDHFIPKSIAPNLAYEWSNFRLSTQKANTNKDNSVGIADPFKILSGWFVLDIPSCLLRPGKGLPSADHQMVDFTIRVLKLNDDDDYVQGRCNVILDYIRGDISYDYMWKKYPFIAHELTRQNLLEDVKKMFKSLR